MGFPQREVVNQSIFNGGSSCEATLGEKHDLACQFRGLRSRNFDLETRAVRDGTRRSEFGEHSEALYLTSSFVFESAAQAAAR